MLATFAELFDCSFRLTTIRGGRATRTREGLRILTRPAIGGRLVMYAAHDDRRVVTSRVVRMFNDTHGGGTYVETHNSLYLLTRES